MDNTLVLGRSARRSRSFTRDWREGSDKTRKRGEDRRGGERRKEGGKAKGPGEQMNGRDAE